MTDELATGLSVAALLVGFPLLLLAGIWLLGRLEAWMLEPDERAETVQELLASGRDADEVEQIVRRLMAGVPYRPTRGKTPPARPRQLARRTRARVKARSAQRTPG